jgi:hypothetical protein
VNSDEKGELVKQLGAAGYINRNEFAGMMRKGGESPEEEKARFKESRRFGKAVSDVLGGAPDIVGDTAGEVHRHTLGNRVRQQHGQADEADHREFRRRHRSPGLRAPSTSCPSRRPRLRRSRGQSRSARPRPFRRLNRCRLRRR